MSTHFPSSDLFLINSGLNSLSLQLRSISSALQTILAEIKSALKSPSWNFSPFHITQLLNDAVVIETPSFTLVELEQQEAELKRLTESLQTSLKEDPLFDARYMCFDSQGILVWKCPDGENEANLQQKMREWPVDVFDVCNLLRTKWSVLTHTMITQKTKGLFTNNFENPANPSQALLEPRLSNPFANISSLSVNTDKQTPPRLSPGLENVISDISAFLSTSAWSESTVNSYTPAELAEKERELKGLKQAFVRALKKDPIFDGCYMQFHHEENCAEGNEDVALTHGLIWTYPQGERNGFENMERKKLECSNEIINVDDQLVKAGKNINQAKKRMRVKPSSTADDWVADSPGQARRNLFASAQVASKLNSMPSKEALHPRGKTEGGFSYLPGGTIPPLPSRSGLKSIPKNLSRDSLSITSSPAPEPPRPVLKPTTKNTNPSIPVTNEIALARLTQAPARPAILKSAAKPAAPIPAAVNNSASVVQSKTAAVARERLSSQYAPVKQSARPLPTLPVQNLQAQSSQTSVLNSVASASTIEPSSQQSINPLAELDAFIAKVAVNIERRVQESKSSSSWLSEMKLILAERLRAIHSTLLHLRTLSPDIYASFFQMPKRRERFYDKIIEYKVNAPISSVELNINALADLNTKLQSLYLSNPPQAPQFILERARPISSVTTVVTPISTPFQTPSPIVPVLDPSESAALAYITRPGVLPAK